jgi:hypothetical protein
LNPGARRAAQPLLLHKLYQPLAVISNIAQAASRFFNDRLLILRKPVSAIPCVVPAHFSEIAL